MPDAEGRAVKIPRRALLVGAAALGAAWPLRRLFGRPRPGRVGRFGPLERDPRGIFDLPEGFSYRIVQRAGELMSDGYAVPSSFDGMGCFALGASELVLLRNHENSFVPLTGPYRTGQDAPPEAYDRHAQGGVTRTVLDRDSLRVLSSNLVLCGTVRNCAGGPSPWGWLSCEETAEAGHGYVFRCCADASRVLSPERIAGYGRYRHEAVAIDPGTHVAYLTEDRDDGCLYRFVPDVKGDPFQGELQAMAIVGHPAFDTGVSLAVGDSVEVAWVPIEEPDPKDDTVRHQGRMRGAARIRRGEGIFFDRGRVFVCSTSGGPEAGGQIFGLSVSRDGRPDRFELLAQSTDRDVLDMPDNITVAPWGDVYMAEDSVAGDQYLRVLAKDGEVSDFGRNAVSQSELAGVCFSPDARTLFVNIYGDGLTLAIRGPFAAA